MKRDARRGALFIALALGAASCGRRGSGGDGGRDADLSCSTLRIEPATVRLETNGAAHLAAEGGSGVALFAIEGDAQGATIELGGGLRAGPRAASFTVVARDAMCGSEARAQAEVVGPFDVQPRMTRVAAGGTVRYTATGSVGTVTYAVLSRPAGTMGSVTPDGVFTAGTSSGSYDLVATDAGSGLQVRLAVDVGAGVPLRPRSPLVAVPAGERVRLDWRGGSGAMETMVAGAAGGRVVVEGDATFFDAAGASPGFVDVTATDRFTSETASVRVLVGDAVGTAPTPRGTQTALGDLGVGDVNGDGRADLIVGHAERSARGLEAGGVLAYYGNAAGGFGERPDVIIEGERERDRFGSTLLVANINGDEFADVIVGAPEQDLGESNRGAVTVFLGSAEGLRTTAEHALVGEDRDHRFGTALFVRDLTGDGAAELIVTAPGAVNPFARTCLGGRAYIYRNLSVSRPDLRGVFEAVPWQTVNLRDALSDDPSAAVPCSTTGMNGGRAVAVMDMDSDARLDLVIGAPDATYGGVDRHGAVIVYRGIEGGRFEPEPAWSIHLEPTARTRDAHFGMGLDVVTDGAMGSGEVLVVRSPDFDGPNPMMPAGSRLGNTGGLWVFPPGSLGAPANAVPADGGAGHRVSVLTTERARGFFYGNAANRGVGRSGALADADGDGRNEYLVGSAASSAPGSVQVFPVGALTGSGALTPASELTHMGNELQGYRVVGLGGAMGPHGVASWAAWRTTPEGLFLGAVDYVGAGAGALSTRWGARASIALQGFGASDRSGAAIALGEMVRGTMHAVVGAPGAHSPALPMAMPTPRPAGDRLRTGAVVTFAAGSSDVAAHAWVDRTDAQLGGGPLVVLDFDGDGSLDLAVGDPNESAGAAPGMGFTSATPDECGAINAMGMPASVGARGVVRIYSLVSGALVERFRLQSARETVRAAAPLYLRNRFGASIAAADVNGDGRDDLIVGRTNAADANGAEVVLGRAADSMGRVLVACNTGSTGAAGATVFDPYLPGATAGYGTQVAAIGDLDRDGCDEVAVSIARAAGASSTITRAGVVIAFGYGAGTQCMGHNAPFMIRVVPDDRPLLNNAVGNMNARADDESDLIGLATGAGAVLARGAGDITGDGVPDLVFRDNDLPFGPLRGPAVEVISGAYIAGLCPNRVCPSGRSGAFWGDGAWRVLALRNLDFPHRRIVPSSGLAGRFGTAIAIGDVTGDSAAELAIGSSDDSLGAPFAGALVVFRGGAATTTQEALLGDPWLIAVGDVAETGSFGASVALARSSAAGAWLLAGAPAGSRNGLGGGVGAAYRWRVEVPR